MSFPNTLQDVNWHLKNLSYAIEELKDENKEMKLQIEKLVTVMNKKLSKSTFLNPTFM